MACALIILVWTIIDYLNSDNSDTQTTNPYEQAVNLWLGSLTNFLAFNIMFECTRLIAFGFLFQALWGFWQLKNKLNLAYNEVQA